MKPTPIRLILAAALPCALALPAAAQKPSPDASKPVAATAKPKDDSGTFLEKVVKNGYMVLINRHETKSIRVELKRTHQDGRVDFPITAVAPKQERIIGPADASFPKLEVHQTSFEPDKK